MIIDTKSHSTSHSSGLITTMVVIVKDSIGNTRKFHTLLDTGYSNSILIVNNLLFVHRNNFISVRKLFMIGTSGSYKSIRLS